MMLGLKKMTILTASAALLVACGEDEGGSKMPGDGSTTPAQFIKSCQTYYTEGSTEKVVGRYNPVPDVQAYGVERYCDCVASNINRTAAERIGQVSDITGGDLEDFEGYDETVVNSTMANKIRESGAEFYAEILAFDRDPEGKFRPGSFKLMGADDECNRLVLDAK